MNNFLSDIRVYTKDLVAFLMDGFAGHDRNVKDPNGQVTMFVYPPNVTSVYQPMDQGIIATLKTGYKNRLLSHLVQTAGNNELQALAKAAAFWNFWFVIWLPPSCWGCNYSGEGVLGCYFIFNYSRLLGSCSLFVCY